MVIPDLRTGYSRVTHPSAAVLGPKPFPARLACVKRAASVRPEPGSNPQGKFDPAIPLPSQEGRPQFYKLGLRSSAIQFSKSSH